MLSSIFTQLPNSRFKLGSCTLQLHWYSWGSNASPKGVSEIWGSGSFTFSHCARPDARTNASTYWLCYGYAMSNCCIFRSDSILVRQSCTLRISSANRRRSNYCTDCCTLAKEVLLTLILSNYVTTGSTDGCRWTPNPKHASTTQTFLFMTVKASFNYLITAGQVYTVYKMVCLPSHKMDRNRLNLQTQSCV